MAIGYYQSPSQRTSSPGWENTKWGGGGVKSYYPTTPSSSGRREYDYNASRIRSGEGANLDSFERAVGRISGGITSMAPKPEEEGFGGAWSQGAMPLRATPGQTAVPRPATPTLPTFTPPKYDEGEVKALTRKHAARPLSKLRETVQAATSRTFDNPNVQRMTLRSALAGYGEGLGAVMGAAGEEARSEYGQRYGRETQAELTKWQAKTQMTMQDWQNSWNLYNRALDMSTPY